jgi:hypothetical protein
LVPRQRSLSAASTFTNARDSCHGMAPEPQHQRHRRCSHQPPFASGRTYCVVQGVKHPPTDYSGGRRLDHRHADPRATRVLHCLDRRDRHNYRSGSAGGGSQMAVVTPGVPRRRPRDGCVRQPRHPPIAPAGPPKCVLPAAWTKFNHHTELIMVN